MSLFYKRLKLLAPEVLVDPVFRLKAAAATFKSGKYPVANVTSDGDSPFFVVGSGRSGNTLLRSMLCAHPAIGIPPEFGGFRSAHRKFTIHGHLPWRGLVAVVLAEIESTKSFEYWNTNLDDVQILLTRLPTSERTFASIIGHVYQAYVREHFAGSSMWGDKTPLNTFNLSRIAKTFPEAKYIHMVRDGRAVVASFLKANLKSGASLQSAAYHWHDAVRRVRRFSSSRGDSEPVFAIRYEDLVTNTPQTLSSLCAFLGVPFDEAMLEHNKVFSRLGDSHLAHHENVSRSVSTSSIDKWKKAFDHKQLRTLNAIIGRDLADLGYDLEDKG